MTSRLYTGMGTGKQNTRREIRYLDVTGRKGKRKENKTSLGKNA